MYLFRIIIIAVYCVCLMLCTEIVNQEITKRKSREYTKDIIIMKIIELSNYLK